MIARRKMTRIIERKTTARETSLPLWPRLQPWTTTTKGGTKEFRDANVKQLSHRVADIDMKIDAWASSVAGTRREPTAPMIQKKPEAD